MSCASLHPSEKSSVSEYGMIYSETVSYFPDLGPVNMVALVQDELPHRTG
jgi:hypothetical protein